MPTMTKRRIPTRAELDAQQSERIDRDFADHIATYSADGVERLIWRKPGSGFYRLNFLCDAAGPLIVTGDVGDAIYATGPQTLRWWAGCDLSYFASKCLASEHGRGYRSWDGEYAAARMGEYLRDAATLGNRQARPQFERRGGWDAVEWKSEWHYWLQLHGHDFFGADYWEYGDIGEVIDARCQYHLVGLKRAVAALDAESSANA